MPLGYTSASMGQGSFVSCFNFSCTTATEMILCVFRAARKNIEWRILNELYQLQADVSEASCRHVVALATTPSPAAVWGMPQLPIINAGAECM